MPVINTRTQENKHTVRNLVVFTVLVIVLGWLGRGLDALAGSPPAEGPGILLWLVAPPVVSFLMRAFAGDGWKDLGIRPALGENAPWYGVSILIYPVCAALVMVVGFITGSVSFPGFSTGGGTGAFVGALGLAAVPGLLTAVEEFGWRGYFAPKMYGLGLNVFTAHALVGLVWGAWHIPYFSVFWGNSMGNMPLFVLCFFLGAVAHSVVYGEIRIITGSVWPAFLMHAAANIFINTLVLQGFARIADGLELIFSPGIEGVLGILFMAAVGVAINRLYGKS